MTASDTHIQACAYLYKLTERLGLACMQDTHPLCPLRTLSKREDTIDLLLSVLDVQIAHGLGINAGKDPCERVRQSPNGRRHCLVLYASITTPS